MAAASLSAKSEQMHDGHSHQAEEEGDKDNSAEHHDDDVSDPKWSDEVFHVSFHGVVLSESVAGSLSLLFQMSLGIR
jgi:hypothetical protein